MSALAGSSRPVELDDVQGLVMVGYKRLTQSCFLLLRVKDAAAARAWLAAASVTSAAAATADRRPDKALHVALTSEGLRALNVAADVREGFSLEFLAGMASDEARARRLGDVGANAPGHWRWGAGERVPHVVVLLYAAPGQLAAWQQDIETGCAAGFDRIAVLSTSDVQGVEPFGFVDGISQPELDWKRERAVRDEDQLAYGNLACLGEFLLGYPNEYGRYTPRPLIDPARDDAAKQLPRAEDAPEQADLGRNGCYLVLRHMRQHVDLLERELDRCANGDADLRERIVTAMVGRKKNGEPLETARDPSLARGARADPLQQNAFTFREDPRGLHCPLGAHIRRVNPRNADLPPGPPGILSRLCRILGFNADALAQDLVASTRFHRLIRRGRKYQVGAETGLHFICLAGNITRQFEFVQSAWVMGTKFDGLPDEADALLGSRQKTLDGQPTDGYSIPQAGSPDMRLSGLPQFVTVLGGAYFFMPGIRALRYLATAR
ncbi:MAG TPA: hypothetical protein VLW55_22415, partial [Burkholderiaceae bacterium]|nr:hypothetical protein [Burkholderiaceae bacterium]